MKMGPFRHLVDQSVVILRFDKVGQFRDFTGWGHFATGEIKWSNFYI